MDATFQEILKAILPVIAMAVSAFLQQNKFSQAANTIIASSTVVACAILSVVIQKQITGNVIGDLVLITAAAVAFQSSYFSAFHQWLMTGKFPEA